ncbi:MAG: hypothetical protein ABUT20_07000 [Bacteroidota bacterium]
MEVHAHTHTPRKKWTHYFWEFLMLFLAVFCGFLAENQREHFVEKQRAKEYAKSLLNDMKEDTSEISGGILQNAFMVEAFDSCISIGMKSIDKQSVPGRFYYFSRFTTNAYSIDWNKSTLTQLIQSGNLRYFGNKKLVNKINRYHSLQGQIISNNDQDYVHRNEITFIRNRLLAPEYYEVFSSLQISEEMKKHVPNAIMDSLMAERLALKSGSVSLLDEYLNNLLDRKWRNKRYVDELYPQALALAMEIIEMLKEEFHLE